MKRSTLWMFVVWGSQAIFVVTDHYFLRGPDAQAYLLAQTLFMSISVFAWFLSDAEAIHYKPSRAMKSGVILLGIVVIPYYLIRRKGLKRAAVSLTRFLAFAVAYSLYAALIPHLMGWRA